MAQVNCVREVSVRSTKRRVSGTTDCRSSADVFRICRDLAGETQEHFVVLHINTRGQVTARQTVGIGTLDSVGVHPRDVFRAAVMQGAFAVILVHNHPSGDPEPSENDYRITERLIAAGDLMGIPVQDHVIIADKNYFSFRETAEKSRRGSDLLNYLNQIMCGG
jgi:DNA repair protein RadC